MAGYVIGQVEITDSEHYQEYIKQVPQTVAQYGGEYLVRGGAYEVLEGQWPERRNVVLKFASVEQAKAWYHSAEYAGPKAIRHAASKGALIVVEGV